MASNVLDFSGGCLGMRGKCQIKQWAPALGSDTPLLSDQSGETWGNYTENIRNHHEG